MARVGGPGRPGTGPGDGMGRGRMATGVHVLDVLEAVAQVTDEWVVHMLEHAPLSYDVPDAFRPDDCGGY